MLASMVWVSAYAYASIQNEPTDCGSEYADWYIPDQQDNETVVRVENDMYGIEYSNWMAAWQTRDADLIEVCIETDAPDESVWWFFSDGAIRMSNQEEPTEQYHITRIGVNCIKAEYETYLPLILN